MLDQKINVDIRRMNHFLRNLSDREEMVTYINHDVYLTDGARTREGLYNEDDHDDIHLSFEGKRQMANYILDHIKNDYFRDVSLAEIDRLASATGVFV